MDQLRFDIVDLKEKSLDREDDFDIYYQFVLDAFINGQSLREHLRGEVGDIDSYDIDYRINFGLEKVIRLAKMRKAY